MKRLLLFAVVATLFAACTQDIVVDVTNPTIADNTPETLVVGFENDDTRIQLNEAQKTVWTNGDLVSVFYRSDANQKWQYTGETGARTAELTRVDAGEATKETQRVVVVYPYNANYYFNTETYNVQASLPATQTYLEDSYGLNGNIMISQSEYNQFSLKSVCGWLKLQLTGDGEKVKSITLRGNNGEQVAGELYINSADATSILASDSGASDDDSEAGGSLIFEDTILTEVTLNCGTGVELGAEATAFYIALPSQTFENGFTVEIEAMDGHIMAKSTDKTLTIERNHIQPMTAFDFAPSYPLSNEIFYTASEQVTPTNPEAFGTTFISSSWDAETGTGVMLFEDELTYIGDYAFEGNAALLSVLLPNSVTELRNCCFRYCSNLTKAVIPGEITDFHSASFEQCHALVTINCRYSTSDLRHVVMNNIYLAYAPAGAEDCVIPDGVKHVESYVFRGSNIASVVIPASVNKIGEQAFLKSANLMAVYCKPTTPPAINASLNGGIFDGNASGRKIYVPKESVWAYKTAEHWSDYADAIVGYDFENGEIVEVQPNNEIWYTATVRVEPNKTDAFGATYVSNEWDSETGKGVITFEGEVTMIGDRSFDSCSKLTSVTIPNGVKTIGEYAFAGCESLTSVTIPDSVTTIGYCAFIYCRGLKEFKGKFAADGGRCLIIDGVLNAFAIDCGVTQYIIPDSVTTIKGSAFEDCDSLTSVTIPDSVTTIGDHVFYDCSSLKTVYCMPTTPPNAAPAMFEGNASGRKIYVPIGSGNAYKYASSWIAYKECIFEDASL
ncbi:MAG: leucine-rich repeat protein [Alistipes sp.]|nr:leucine-rich repeat protein [Alistipes sp.]